jgi:hypothetical protein
MSLGAFQDAFASALWQKTPIDNHAAPSPAWLRDMVEQPGFAVYRNTVIKGCIDALQANYPTVCDLVGEEWLRAAASIFAAAHPPEHGRLMDYGQGFAAFLERFPPAAELPYLSAIATLDRCWTECHLAVDAPTLDPTWLATQLTSTSAGDISTLVLRPHPAARWVQCADHPAFAIWQRQRDGKSLEDEIPWVGDAGLLTRPQAGVQWMPLSSTGYALMHACAQGLPLLQAFEQATEPAFQDPHTAPDSESDLSQLIAQLLQAGAFQAPLIGSRP